MSKKIKDLPILSNPEILEEINNPNFEKEQKNKLKKALKDRFEKKHSKKINNMNSFLNKLSNKNIEDFNKENNKIRLLKEEERDDEIKGIINERKEKLRNKYIKKLDNIINNNIIHLQENYKNFDDNTYNFLNNLNIEKLKELIYLINKKNFISKLEKKRLFRSKTLTNEDKIYYTKIFYILNLAKYIYVDNKGDIIYRENNLGQLFNKL
jgi:hypothetical protein